MTPSKCGKSSWESIGLVPGVVGLTVSTLAADRSNFLVVVVFGRFAMQVVLPMA